MIQCDWEQMKTEYATTNASHRSLSKKYDIPKSSIEYHSVCDDWVEARREFRSGVAEKAADRLQDEAADRIVRLMSGTERVLTAAEAALQDDQQFHRYLVQVSGDGEKRTEEQTFRKVDTKALRELTAVLKDLTELTRDLYGIPAQAQEKQVVEVVFSGGEETWNE